jgi:2-amino-4-hydroxy-6-hydroxymethyldihydropteridine diphosphokinase
LAYLSLGSNLGDRIANLRTAIQRLASIGTVQKVSSFYETEPVEVIDQPWFVNCVVALESDLAPRDLLQKTLAIEHEMHRERVRNKGPRTIDIDILLYGDCVFREPGLKIPHPAMHQRRFVLEPLVEIAPGVIHPVLKKKASEMLAALPAGHLVRRLAHDGAGESREPKRESRKPTAR